MLSNREFPFDLNPYESFMRRHLQHYGYFTDHNLKSNQILPSTNCFSGSDSSDCEDDDTDVSGNSASNPGQDFTSDGRNREGMIRTTQLVYTVQAGRMVLQLREPRQLHNLYSGVWGPQQPARWPAGIQVAIERVRHITWNPTEMEPFYRPTGQEVMPLAISHRGHGRIVYEYEPSLGNFFVHANVNRNMPCQLDEASVELQSDEDCTLIFESRFESGNLAKAVQVGLYEYELWLRTDLYTSKHTQWFYFMVSNTRSDVTYRFTIVNFMKPDSLYNNGMRPLMYSERLADTQKVGWLRTGADIKYYKNNITYTNGKADKPYYSLTWTCNFPSRNDTVYFAHCYPYTYSDLQDYINDIMTDPFKSRYCRQRLLCRTLAGNLIYLLTITSPPTSDSSDDFKHRKAVVLSSRVHPGETNSSWMMKGFLDFLLSGSNDAKLLCDNFVFKIIPMLNPDGVIVGNYRCSLTGHDLNRNYKITLKESFPSIWHTKNMIKRLLEEREVILYCDLHGHSRHQNVFIYGCDNRSDPQRRLREQIFPYMLSRNAPDLFNFDDCRFQVQKNKEGTGRVVMWNMGVQNSYTLEATFCGSMLGKKRGYHFNATDFESMGYYFCDTLLDYCDPDTSKAVNALSCVEDRLKTEILHRLRQQGTGSDGSVAADVPKDISEIDLNKHYTCDIESSDGGSDSSVSDGPPVQVQYAAKMQKKKKRLKTRKERDLNKNPPKNASKQSKDTKRSGPACAHVRQCLLREHHQHLQDLQQQDQSIDRKMEPRNVRLLKQPSQKSLYGASYRPFRYPDTSLDAEVPAFLQERLEDGNARRISALHNAELRLRESYDLSAAASRDFVERHDIRSKSLTTAATTRDIAKLPKSQKFQTDDNEELASSLTSLDYVRHKSVSPSYVTLMPFLRHRSTAAGDQRTSRWHGLEGISPTVQPAPVLSSPSQTIMNSDLTKFASVPSDVSQQSITVQNRPYTTEPVVSRVEKPALHQVLSDSVVTDNTVLPIRQPGSNARSLSLPSSSNSPNRHQNDENPTPPRFDDNGSGGQSSVRRRKKDKISPLYKTASTLSADAVPAEIALAAASSSISAEATTGVDTEHTTMTEVQSTTRSVLAKQQLNTLQRASAALPRRGRSESIGCQQLAAPAQFVQKTVQPLKRPSFVNTQQRSTTQNSIIWKQ